MIEGQAIGNQTVRCLERLLVEETGVVQLILLRTQHTCVTVRDLLERLMWNGMKTSVSNRV